MKTYKSPDGTEWRVQVQLHSTSNALVLFRHPNGDSSHLDRYNWLLSSGPESKSVTTTVRPSDVEARLDAGTLARLFGRSIAVSRPATSAKKSLGL